MDHVFIIFPRSRNTKRILYNTKYGLKELNKICGLNTHLDSLSNLQHLYQILWRFYQGMRGFQGMHNTLLYGRRSPVRFSATVRVSTQDQWVQPLAQFHQGVSGWELRPGAHSFWRCSISYISQLIPCTKFQRLPKNWECCQNQESPWVNPIHRKGQQGHLLCFT